jgi:hypothetical protein
MTGEGNRLLQPPVLKALLMTAGCLCFLVVSIWSLVEALSAP